MDLYNHLICELRLLHRDIECLVREEIDHHLRVDPILDVELGVENPLLMLMDNIITETVMSLYELRSKR